MARIIDSIAGLALPRRGVLEKSSPRKPQGTLVPKVGTGTPVTASSSGAGGVASPLTEKASTREYHVDIKEWYSSDGLFVVQHRNVKTIHMLDANNEEVVFNYEDVETPIPDPIQQP